MKKRRLALAGLSMLCVGEYVHAASQAQIDLARTKAAAWLITQQKGDGNWSTGQGADISVTAQSLAGLMAAGVKGFPVNSAGAWLGNADAQSVDGLSRQIRTKAVPFANVTALHGKLLTWKSAADRATWGSYPLYSMSMVDTALGLLATLSATFPYPTQDAEIKAALNCNVLSSQTGTGGWPHLPSALNTPGTVSAGAALPTALTVSALKAVQTKYGWDAITSPSCAGSYSINTALTNAANWLVTQKNGDGGIGESGTSSVFSTALGYQAIKSVRPADAALPGLIDYLIARQDASGSWGGEPMQTGLALEQLAAIATPLVDTDGDGIPDAIELVLGTNPLVADARSLANKGSGNGVPGVGLPMTLATTAIVGQVFNYTLNSALGVAPFTWSLTGGALPPGLVLSSSGLIAGAPTQLGSYTFQYASVDSGAPSITRSTLGLITVVRRVPGNGDVNGDGKVDLADLILAQRIAFGLIVPTSAQQAAADVAPDGDPDGVIDAADVAWITRKILQQR